MNTYLQTALWASSDDDQYPLDANYAARDVAPETRDAMNSDVADFFAANAADIEACGQDDETVAHDLWLTRNRHGAGFWDGDYPEPQAGRLTAAAHAMGEYHLYVGDDGQIHGIKC